MTRLGDLAEKVRSKNAGPFWLTIDVFCRDADYARITAALSTERIAALFDVPVGNVRRFEIDDLAVLKFSFPRPAVQGTVADRDMHGASFACLLEEMEL